MFLSLLQAAHQGSTAALIVDVGAQQVLHVVPLVHRPALTGGDVFGVEEAIAKGQGSWADMVPVLVRQRTLAWATITSTVV